MSEEDRIAGVSTKIHALTLDTANEPGAVLLEVYEAAVEKLKRQWAKRNLVPMEDITVELRVSCVARPKENLNA